VGCGVWGVGCRVWGEGCTGELHHHQPPERERERDRERESEREGGRGRSTGELDNHEAPEVVEHLRRGTVLDVIPCLRD